GASSRSVREGRRDQEIRERAPPHTGTNSPRLARLNGDPATARWPPAQFLRPARLSSGGSLRLAEPGRRPCGSAPPHTLLVRDTMRSPLAADASDSPGSYPTHCDSTKQEAREP